MTALCSAPISLQAVMTCYTLNAQRKNDNNLLLLVKFLQRLPRVLALLGENEGSRPPWSRAAGWTCCVRCAGGRRR